MGVIELKMEDEDSSMCNIDIDTNGDIKIRGKYKDKCKDLLKDIEFEEA